MRRSIVALCLVLPLMVAAGGGGDDGPRSPKARAALKKYDRAVGKAREAHDRAVAAAARELDQELGAAIKAAMAAGSLDEAKRIEAKRLPGPAAAAAPPDGSRWKVTYANDVTRVYRVSGTGVAWEGGGGGRTGKLAHRGARLLFDFGDGKVERFTPAGPDGYFVEHFSRAADLADDAVGDVLGVATRLR